MGVLVRLAEQIRRNAYVIDDYLHRHGLPDPSFEREGPVDLLPSDARIELQALKQTLEAVATLNDLLVGPNELLRPALNGTSLQLIHRYNIAEKVPRESAIRYEDLAKKTGLDIDLLKRCIRYAISHHRVFVELRRGEVSHSAASIRLIDDAQKRDAFGLMIDGFYPGYARTIDSMQLNSETDKRSTGFTLAHGSACGFYDYLDNAPELRAQFASAMSSFAKLPGAGLDSLYEKFEWQQLAPGSLVVDVGGSVGATSIYLSERLPQLKFVSQDRASVIGNDRSITPRVHVMVHDFLEPQTVSADVYLFRWIMHNWPDDDCVSILRNLIPALREGACVIINDMVMSECEPRTLQEERYLRSNDLLMLSLFHGKERTMEEWQRIVRLASEDFRYESTSALSQGSEMAVLKIYWQKRNMGVDARTR